MTPTQLFIIHVMSLLGLQIAGDVDGLTFYTNRRGKIVAYPIAPPKELPSLAQIQQRSRFAAAQQNWSLETQAVKAAWETIVRKNSIRSTGQNLYISASLAPNSHMLHTLATKAGVAVSDPAYIAW